MLQKCRPSLPRCKMSHKCCIIKPAQSSQVNHNFQSWKKWVELSSGDANLKTWWFCESSQWRILQIGVRSFLPAFHRLMLPLWQRLQLIYNAICRLSLRDDPNKRSKAPNYRFWLHNWIGKWNCILGIHVNHHLRSAIPEKQKVFFFLRIFFLQAGICLTTWNISLISLYHYNYLPPRCRWSVSSLINNVRACHTVFTFLRPDFPNGAGQVKEVLAQCC